MFIDEPLVRRLEAQNRWFYAGLSSAPGSYLDLGDGFAHFAGEGSPHTLASGSFKDEQLDRIDAFYRGRTSSWQAPMTPFSDAEGLQRLMNRGATVEGWENLYYRPTSVPLASLALAPELKVREATGDQISVWAQQCTLGYFGEGESAAAQEFRRLMEEATVFRRYLAFWEEEPVAVASLTIGLGIGYLGDMRTLPAYRGRGIQTALIHHRLQTAASKADLVMVGTVPGNASYRNVARMGFQVAYSQLSVRVPVR